MTLPCFQRVGDTRVKVDVPKNTVNYVTGIKLAHMMFTMIREAPLILPLESLFIWLSVSIIDEMNYFDFDSLCASQIRL